jgi:hypothetical protein
MEVLVKILIAVIGFFTALSVPFIGWVGISIVDMKVDLAETHAKVDANYQMIRPIWEKFISEKSVANFTLADVPANQQAGE